MITNACRLQVGDLEPQIVGNGEEADRVGPERVRPSVSTGVEEF